MQQAIADVAAERANDIAHGRSALTGVSAFALLADDGVTVEPHPAAPPVVRGGTEVVALVRQRLAAPFERLRDAADAYAQRTGRRPRVFLAALGTPAMHSARAAWMSNFLAAGGIEALPSADLEGAEHAGRAFTESGASIACICSSDRAYAELAQSTVQALKAAGARRVMLAGRPKAQQAALRAAGIDAFIAAGDDAPRTLGELHQWLGVAA
jgi:methylmalonyl-CoA mutase